MNATENSNGTSRAFRELLRGARQPSSQEAAGGAATCPAQNDTQAPETIPAHRSAESELNPLPYRRAILFALFFLSGSSGLIYQVVWTRMAFAAFGIIMPVLSVVISVFMLGLSLGAWLGGRYIGRLAARTGHSALAFYGAAEFIIGLGAFVVPQLFDVGKQLLLSTGQTDSAVYLGLSALVLAVSILPWCVFMGATFPLMMAYVREREPETQSADSFSYLYLANVLGAMSGTLLSAFVLIEIFGFRDTLRLSAVGNLMIVAVAVWLCRKDGAAPANAGAPAVRAQLSTGAAVAKPTGEWLRLLKWTLFTTGFISMAMEVVWVRAFAPVLKTQVYSFALVVAAYLGATFHGSLLYRRHLRRGKARPTGELLALLMAAALLPVLINSERFLQEAWWTMSPQPRYIFFLLASIWPFCAILGYLTPSLVDRYAAGSPKRAGSAYAINVLGCILGPLFGAYVLLPQFSERWGLILLSLPFAAFALALGKSLTNRQRFSLAVPAAAMLAAAMFLSLSYEDVVARYAVNAKVRRDYAATVVSCGTGFERRLVVNGFGMTQLAPCTKFMAHLPLGLHQGPPESALIICFGMGTSFRSALSWGIQTTAVELVPGVRDAFGFYHEDAGEVLKNPKGRIVIDDGRRYLQRTADTYDAIVIDPPPPVETAGSSLLYSKEFYEVAKRRLKPGGILQAWIPENSTVVFAAALRTLRDAFPYVRCISGYGGPGAHMLGSMQPIELCSPAEFMNRLPASAKADALEWSSEKELTGYLQTAFANEAPGKKPFVPQFRVRITDDRPFNEYFLVRQTMVY
jgi:predicted membrane-bound spermidine synthase